MSILSDLGARVRAALAPLAGALVYRTTSTFACRAASATPTGSTMITLTGLPAGMTGVEEGDRINAGTITVSATVSATGGTIADVPLSAPLPASIAAGAMVQVQHDSDTPCRGWFEEAETRITVGVSVVTGSRVYVLPTDSLPAAPVVNAFIVDAGRSWQIKAVSTDPMGAVWRCTTV